MMKETVLPIVVSLFGTIMVLGIVAGSVYGCDQARKHYYDAMETCVTHGGTFVPSVNSNVSCVLSK